MREVLKVRVKLGLQSFSHAAPPLRSLHTYHSCSGHGSLQHPWYHAEFDLGSFIYATVREGTCVY